MIILCYRHVHGPEVTPLHVDNLKKNTRWDLFLIKMWVMYRNKITHFYHSRNCYLSHKQKNVVKFIEFSITKRTSNYHFFWTWLRSLPFGNHTCTLNISSICSSAQYNSSDDIWVIVSTSRQCPNRIINLNKPIPSWITAVNICM